MDDPRALLATIAREHGTPCYVTFLDRIRDDARRLRDAFEGLLEIGYAVKANPNRALLARLGRDVERLDVSSIGEARRAIDAGWEPGRIGFTGPGKRDVELEKAVAAGIGQVVLESVEEARRLDEIAARQATHQTVILRLSPRTVPRGYGGRMAGRPTAFGVDEEDAGPAIDEIRALDRLRLEGFHAYPGTQCLEEDSIAENLEILLDLFGRLAEEHDLEPRWLVLGAGLGIPYHEGDEPLDLEVIAQRVAPRLRALRDDARLAAATCVLEVGRYVVGPAGWFVTRVLRTKRSRGTSLAVCDGGLHHHLAACGHFGTVIHRNWRIEKVDGAIDAERAPFDIVGPLCTTIDTLARGVELPGLEAGDVLAVGSSGAYGLTASPIHFISHDPPRELLVETRDGEVVIEDVSEHV